MEWVVLETAPNQPIAQMWCELLQEQGVPAFAKLPDTGGPVVGGASNVGCWVMVPDTHRKKAAAVLDSLLKPKPRRRRK